MEQEVELHPAELAKGAEILGRLLAGEQGTALLRLALNAGILAAASRQPCSADEIAQLANVTTLMSGQSLNKMCRIAGAQDRSRARMEGRNPADA